MFEGFITNMTRADARDEQERGNVISGMSRLGLRGKLYRGRGFVWARKLVNTVY